MLALVLEFETAPARKSLVATRYMLATWVSLIFHCLLPIIVFIFSVWSVKLNLVIVYLKLWEKFIVSVEIAQFQEAG